jgi:phage host-nuclease inhibitor protein Gam
MELWREYCDTYDDNDKFIKRMEMSMYEKYKYLTRRYTTKLINLVKRIGGLEKKIKGV